MIGVDTNLLVRFFIYDDDAQYKLVDKLFQDQEQIGDFIFISNIVLVELVWALRSGYNVSKHDIIQTLTILLSNPLFQFTDHSLILMALDKYKSGLADFADYLIGATGKKYKTETTYTFDKKSGKDSLFTLLGS